MEEETERSKISLNWLAIWRDAFFHPTVQTFTQIASDPKASTWWGIIWMGVTALIVWFLGPQRELLWGMVSDNFGPRPGSNFLIIAAVGYPILSMVALLVIAGLAHGLARLFGGAGAYHQLVFCWGVIQLPFILLIGIASRLPPYVYSLFRSLSSSKTNFEWMRIILLISGLIAAAGLLYLAYAQLAAFSAVEKVGIGKGFGILILVALLLAIAGACLSYGFQSLLMRGFGY
jgi:hypothetical protein